MAEVGEAAGRGQAPSPVTQKKLEQLAVGAPLYPEPFLVRGALAQRADDHRRAAILLLHARQREPRSAAARYLLGESYLRRGLVVPGLAEISVFSRLVPGAVTSLAPALAEFARSGGSVAQVKRILRAYPELEPAVLSHLAEDVRNTKLILSLARPGADANGPPQWQSKLIENLITGGDFGTANSLWATFSGVDGARRGLFNPTFRRSDIPPPFNWMLSSTGGGVAEPAVGGGLHVLYFGREDVVLAKQLLLLTTGRYRLSTNVTGEDGSGSAIAWTLTCLPGKQQVLDILLAERLGTDRVSGEFHIPAQDCGAQWLELKGKSREFPKPADFRISGLQLTRLGG